MMSVLLEAAPPRRLNPAIDQNWDAAFKKMAVMGDDALLVRDDSMSDWDDTEWEWCMPNTASPLTSLTTDQ